MFQRLLVPLDGSKRAEQAIVVAARIARASGGSIILLRVVSTQIEVGTYITEPSVLMQEALEADLTRAINYLAKVRMSNELAGLETHVEVRSGASALTILDAVHAQGVDLIVMCSHGDTGFKRWMLGSVAQEVARHSPIPVLILREGGPMPTSSFPDPIRPLRGVMGLVALDGSTLAESALEPAARLVAALAFPAHGILQLTKAVKLTESKRISRGSVDPRVKDDALYEAETYLSAVADRIRRGEVTDLHLGVVYSVATGKDVADALLKVAEMGKAVEGTVELGSCDLIVMATHGRGGLQRLAMGSVVEHVLGATKLPLLIVHTCPSDRVRQEEQTIPEPTMVSKSK